MSNRLRVGWVCNSAIETSETFLLDNLKLLQTFADVRAYSGNKPQGDKHPDITALDFDDVPQSFYHVLRRKFTGKDVRTLTKRQQCKQQLQQELHSFEPDFLWIEFGTTAHIACDLLTALNKPYFIAVHGFDVTREFCDPWYTEEFVRLANASLAVVCASKHTRNLCLAAGVDQERCKVVRLPIDGIKFKPAPHPPSSPASFVHFGRLVEKKGPVQTLLAFEQVLKVIPDATLTIIGDGPLRETLEKRISKLEIDESIRLTGALPQNEALNLVREHSVFCQHSVTGTNGDQEGFALSPAEAALMELPIVSTLHNGIPEHVIQGETGLLVREWDIEGMAEAMIELATNPEKAMKMGKAGRQNILKLCNPTSRKSNLQSLFSSTL